MLNSKSLPAPNPRLRLQKVVFHIWLSAQTSPRVAKWTWGVSPTARAQPTRTCLTSACRCRSCTHCSRCLRCCSAATSSSCCFSWRNSSRSWTRVAMSTSLSQSSSTPGISQLFINDLQVFQRQTAHFHCLTFSVLSKSSA